MAVYQKIPHATEKEIYQWNLECKDYRDKIFINGIGYVGTGIKL